MGGGRGGKKQIRERMLEKGFLAFSSSAGLVFRALPGVGFEVKISMPNLRQSLAD